MRAGSFEAPSGDLEHIHQDVGQEEGIGRPAVHEHRHHGRGDERNAHATAIHMALQPVSESLPPTPLPGVGGRTCLLGVFHLTNVSMEAPADLGHPSAGTEMRGRTAAGPQGGRR